MNYKNKNIGILGLGVSGYWAAKLAHSLGANVFISDASSNVNNFFVEELKSLGVDVELGSHSNKILNTDLIIKSPGISNNIQIIKKLLEKKLPVISEIEFAHRLSDFKIIAVTGTNGKTTTVTCLYEVLKNDFNVIKSGNIGNPLSETVFKKKNKDNVEIDYCILELSSFQIDDTNSLKPYIALILNISNDHQDRYKNFEDYINSKMKLTRNMNDNDLIIYNYDNEILREKFLDINKNFTSFSLEKEFSKYFLYENKIKSSNSSFELNINECSLLGIHNISNFIGVATLASYLGLNDKSIFKSLKRFKGLNHRFELFKEINGIKFINDSKATNIDSVRVALESIDRNVILIMGGLPKDSNFSEILKFSQSIKSIIAYGSASNQIYDSLSIQCNVLKIEEFDEAVNSSIKLAEKGDLVLMSPGCASYDQFKNFEERGDRFKNIVERYYS